MNRLKLILLLLLMPVCATAAPYTLEIIHPEEGLNTVNRYYKQYTGIPYEVPVGVYGGMYPFTYELTVAPAGMTITPDTGIITWANPIEAGSPHDVTVRVTDAENNVDTASWTITVDTTMAVFVDAVNGVNSEFNGCTPPGCGTGTIDNPFRDMCDVEVGDGIYACGTYDSNTQTGSMLDNTYDNHFIYFRTGTYATAGYLNNSGQQIQLEWRGQYKPMVWLGYPGDTVVMDFDITNQGAFYDFNDGVATNTFVGNMKFQDMLNHAFRLASNNVVFYDNIFENLGPGASGANSSFLMVTSGGLNNLRYYHFYKHNIFTDLNIGAYLKMYSLGTSVIESNQFYLPSGSPIEGISMKAYDTTTSIRANFFDGDFRSGAISGDWNRSENFEVSFNLILNAGDNCPSTLDRNAIRMNGFSNTSLPVYLYRNTVDGCWLLRGSRTGNGPFYADNNVIVGSNPGIEDSFIVSAGTSVQDESVLVVGTGANANLVGYPADNIIDANGNLTENYSQYVGFKGHQISDIPPQDSVIYGSFDIGSQN